MSSRMSDQEIAALADKMKPILMAVGDGRISAESIIVLVLSVLRYLEKRDASKTGE